MPTKFFPIRKTKRFLDTVNAPSAGDQGSHSFFGLATPSATVVTAFNVLDAARTPINQISGGKAASRTDCILITDLDIPNNSKVLSGEIVLITDNVAFGGNLPRLEVGIYNDLAPLDVDVWRGGKNTAEFVWKHPNLSNRKTTTLRTSEKQNFWTKLYEGITVLGQSSLAASGSNASATNPIVFGRVDTDLDTSTTGIMFNAIGQVILIDTSSAAASTMDIILQRSGAYVGTVNTVCRVYSYNVTNRTVGDLRATSNAVAAGSYPSSGTARTTFTFGTTFTCTAGEYLMLAIEPQTTWSLTETVNVLGMATLGATGSNAAGSEEIMFKQMRNTGNASIYFFASELPLLYSGISGTTIVDTPYLGVIDTLTLIPTPSKVSQIIRVPLSKRLLNCIEQIVRGPNFSAVRGIMFYLGTGDQTGVVSPTVNWDLHSSNIGLKLSWRNQRTFIT
jgi:hypothetical protein